MMSSTSYRLAAVLLAFTLVAASCGGDDDDAADLEPAPADEQSLDDATGDQAVPSETTDEDGQMSEDDMSDGEEGMSEEDGAEAPGETTSRVDEILERYYEGTFRDLPASSPPPVEGASVWVINLLSTSPSVSNIAQGIQDAGALLGWDVTVFDGLGTSQGWNDGIRQAIAADADAIVMNIIECESVAPLLEQARDAGIVIYGAIGADCDIPEVGLPSLYDGHTFKTFPGGRQQSFEDGAAASAAWIIANAGDDANVMEMVQPDFRTVVIGSRNLNSAMADLCPGCVLTQTEFLLVDLFGSELRAKTEAGLLANPDVNVVVFPYDTAVLLGGAAAVTGSGRDLLAMGGECLDANVELIREAAGQDACIAVPYPWVGWATADAVNRLLQGEPEVDPGIGSQLIDRDHNLPESGVTFDGYADYQANYRDIWGVG